GRVQREQPLAGEEDRVAHAVDGRGDRRRVAGVVVRRLPHLLAAVLVERDHAGVPGADVDQQQVALDERRGADAEEVGAQLVLRRQRLLPDLLAALQIDARQHALRAERVDLAAGHDRRRTRAVALAVLVLVLRGVGVLPDRLALVGVEALEHFLVADAVEEEDALADDDGGGVPFADRHGPALRRPLLRPRLEQPVLGGGAVAVRPEELRPVRGGGEGGQRQQRGGERLLRGHFLSSFFGAAAWTHRKPTVSLRVSAGRPCRNAERAASAPSFHEPPRTTRSLTSLAAPAVPSVR